MAKGHRSQIKRERNAQKDTRPLTKDMAKTRRSLAFANREDLKGGF